MVSATLVSSIVGALQTDVSSASSGAALTSQPTSSMGASMTASAAASPTTNAATINKAGALGLGAFMAVAAAL